MTARYRARYFRFCLADHLKQVLLDVRIVHRGQVLSDLDVL